MPLQYVSWGDHGEGSYFFARPTGLDFRYPIYTLYIPLRIYHHMAIGQNNVPPVNIPIPTKKDWHGWCTYPKMVPLVLTHGHIPLFPLKQNWVKAMGPELDMSQPAPRGPCPVAAFVWLPQSGASRKWARVPSAGAGAWHSMGPQNQFIQGLQLTSGDGCFAQHLGAFGRTNLGPKQSKRAATTQSGRYHFHCIFVKHTIKHTGPTYIRLTAGISS